MLGISRWGEEYSYKTIERKKDDILIREAVERIAQFAMIHSDTG